jgi:heme exporter protein D
MPIATVVDVVNNVNARQKVVQEVILKLQKENANQASGQPAP